MACCLGAVPARRHVAPASPPGPRGVIEHPPAAIVVADPDALGVAARQLGHEWVAQAGERVVDRIADVAMVDRDAAVGGRYELDDLARMQRSIDSVQRASCGGRWSTMASTSRSAPRTAWMRASLVPRLSGRDRLTIQPLGALRVDDAALDEPRERVAERRQTLERETVLEVVRVHEIEGVLEVHVVGVVARGVASGSRWPSSFPFR